MMDYVSILAFIDVADSVTDLLPTYSRDFLSFLIQMAKKVVAENSYDSLLLQNAVFEINQP